MSLPIEKKSFQLLTLKKKQKTKEEEMNEVLLELDKDLSVLS